MPFMTKDEVRRAARSRMQKSYSASASQVLRESVAATSTTGQFDVFLSHSYEDAEIVLGVMELLVGRGLTVYVDWIQDPQLSRENVTAETADILRQRMRASKSLLFITTGNSAKSKWMPWELGYFDGYRHGFIGILPVVESKSDRLAGQEFLGLYPTVEELSYTEGGSDYFVVEKSRKGYRTLDSFARGNVTIKPFG